MIGNYRYCPLCAEPLITRTDPEGRRRRICPTQSCGYVFWSNPTPAVAALVEHRGDIILARGAGWPEGWFALVTGYLERNEDPIRAVAREIKEELGLDAVATNVIGNYIFERKNEVMLCYHVVCEGEINLGAELAEVRRYKPHELRPWPRATGYAVADWMRARRLPVEFVDFPGRHTDS
jgi:NADH pyrophosphatase NudC (nudix superfamily)